MGGLPANYAGTNAGCCRAATLIFVGFEGSSGMVVVGAGLFPESFPCLHFCSCGKNLLAGGSLCLASTVFAVDSQRVATLAKLCAGESCDSF